MKAHALFLVLSAASLGALHAQSPTYPEYPSSNGNRNFRYDSRRDAATAPTSSAQPLSSANGALPLSQLANEPVRGSNQEQFGTVSDFLIDAQTGAVAYAVVPSGGATYRLVPMAAVDAGSGQGALVLRISQAQWNQAGTITEAEIRGQVTLHADQVQRIARQFGLAGQENAAALSNLVRATALRGQPVRSGTQPVGTIDDVLVDLTQRSAAVALRLASGYAARQSTVVPFAQLQFGNEGAITTTLGRNEFSSTNPRGNYSSSYARNDDSSRTPRNDFSSANPRDNFSSRYERGDYASANTGLSPTGYMDPAQAAAAAVQQALANRRAFAGNTVQVTRDGRILLRGTVRSPEERAEVERIAAEAAPGAPIEDQLTVRGW